MGNSTQSKQIWTILGAVLLQIVLLFAAFSLGVYTEREGSERAPAANRPTPAATRALPAGVEGDPQLISRILRLTPDGFEMAIPNGPQVVIVSETTTYVDTAGTALTRDDLQPQISVAIYGLYEADGRLLAERVVVLQAAP